MHRNILHFPFSILHLLIPLSFAGVMIGHGSEKAGVGSPSNAGLEDEPSTSLVNAGLGDEHSTSLVSAGLGDEPSTSLDEPSTSMVASLVRHCEVVGASSRPQSSVALNEPFSRIERWFRRGAWEDGFVIPFDADWVFPHASNHLSQVEIWSQGAIYPSEKAAEPIASVQTPLALKPGETEVFYGRTTNDTYRIEWHNAHPNRDANQLADAAIELKRNGDALVTENGVTTEIPYEIPFEHDGFGQDDDWVIANIDDADAALASGYPDWVDAQIGVGLTNGLCKFTAYFADDPPEPTQLYIGDYSICVTNAGEYSFVLEKGVEYEFGTWPFTDDVDYFVEDDLAPQRSLRTAFGWEPAADDAVWTKDNEIFDFWRPWRYGVNYHKDLR